MIHFSPKDNEESGSSYTMQSKDSLKKLVLPDRTKDSPSGQQAAVLMLKRNSFLKLEREDSQADQNRRIQSFKNPF